MEMIHGEAERAVDLLAIRTSQASARVRSRDQCGSVRLRTLHIAREQHYIRTLIGENFGNRFPDPHRSAGYHDNFPCKFHDVLLFYGVSEVNSAVALKKKISRTTGDLSIGKNCACLPNLRKDQPELNAMTRRAVLPPCVR